MVFTGQRIENLGENSACLHSGVDGGVLNAESCKGILEALKSIICLLVEECLKTVPQPTIFQCFLDVEAQKVKSISLPKCDILQDVHIGNAKLNGIANNAVLTQYACGSQHFHWLPEELVIFIQSSSAQWVGFAKNILNVRNGIFRLPNIWRLKRLTAAALNIVHNTVSNEAYGIKSTFLVNPTAIA